MWLSCAIVALMSTEPQKPEKPVDSGRIEVVRTLIGGIVLSLAAGILAAYALSNHTGRLSGAQYVTDTNGVNHVVVEVDPDAEIPDDWQCLPMDPDAVKKEPVKATCMVPIGTGEVSDDELDRRIDDALDRQGAPDPPEITVKVDNSDDGVDWIALLGLVVAAFAALVGAIGLVWVIVTKPEDVQRVTQMVRQWRSGRKRSRDVGHHATEDD